MSDPSKPIWGAAAIAEEINRNEQQTHRLLRLGAIRSAKKVRGIWCAIPAALRREFGGVAEKQREEVA